MNYCAYFNSKQKSHLIENSFSLWQKSEVVLYNPTRAHHKTISLHWCLPKWIMSLFQRNFLGKYHFDKLMLEPIGVRGGQDILFLNMLRKFFGWNRLDSNDSNVSRKRQKLISMDLEVRFIITFYYESVEALHFRGEGVYDS